MLDTFYEKNYLDFNALIFCLFVHRVFLETLYYAYLLFEFTSTESLAFCSIVYQKLEINIFWEYHEALGRI